MNAREKGKRGEREWAGILRDLGLSARRGAQFCGGPDSPDVIGGFEGTHAEVKRVEKLDIYKAVEQAMRDSAGKALPYVAHRKNGSDWLVTVRLEDLKKFLDIVARFGAVKYGLSDEDLSLCKKHLR